MDDRKSTEWTNLMVWIAFGLVGLLTGFTASMMVWVEDNLTDWRANTVDTIISSDSSQPNAGVWAAFSYFVLFSMACSVVSSIMTVYWGPGANGSGVAEIIAYMNGVNYPDVFAFSTYLQL